MTHGRTGNNIIPYQETSMQYYEKHVSELGNNNEGHNNELSNIGSIRRNVRLPFLFDYNQKNQEYF